MSDRARVIHPLRSHVSSALFPPLPFVITPVPHRTKNNQSVSRSAESVDEAL